MNIDEEIAELLHHDLSINLDADAYKEKLSSYECTLLYMMSIGRQFINENERDFKLLIFDFDDKITVNQKFRIVNYTSDLLEAKSEANFILEFIEDVASEKKYYIIQKKGNSKNVDFQGIKRNSSVSSFTFNDFKNIIDKFIAKEALEPENITFDIITHKVDFKEGSWLIEKPYFAT